MSLIFAAIIDQKIKTKDHVSVALVKLKNYRLRGFTWFPHFLTAELATLLAARICLKV
jgi:hypothetical protein